MMNLTWFSDSVVFSQEIKMKAPTAVVNGTITYMVCTDEMCLPSDEINFSIPVNASR